MNYFDRQVTKIPAEELLRRGRRAGQAALAGYASARRGTAELLAQAKTGLAARRLRALGQAVAAWPAIRAFKREPRFWLSLAVIIAALLSSVATFLILNNLTFIFPSSNVVIGTLGISATFVLAIIGIIGFQIAKLLKARKRQAAGAGLHFKFAGLFSLVALFPAILLAVSATVTIDRTFNAFFSTGVRSIVTNSAAIAESYMQESGHISDIAGVASAIEEKASLYRDDKAAFDQYFSTSIPLPAVVIDGKGNVLFPSSSERRSLGALDPSMIAQAAHGEVVLVGLAGRDTNGAAVWLKKLKGFGDAYFYAVRPVKPRDFQLYQRAQESIARFETFDLLRLQYQFVFGMMYVFLALTLLTTSIWIGLVFASRLLTPIRTLIGAAQEVSQGNLNVQLDAGFARDDIGRLGATFKKMTVDLKTQRDDIMSANAELDERRRFIEAVLSGVTAGVIGLDSAGCVTLINRSARELLRLKEAKLLGKPLNAAVPEFAEVIQKARRQTRTKAVQSQITIVRESGERNFAVQVTREEAGKGDYGVVVTFDDVTELTVAQRTSAWADVARRIAHEIKNPLTPIQLSAERIRRKYGASITADREIFDKCTDTIIRHVGDIGRMVDEFSSFARMPGAVFEEQDIREAVREAVILFQMSRPEIEYKLDLLNEPLMALCDRRLLSQAVTNLVKNASEAVDAYQSQNGQEREKGRVLIRLRASDHRFVIGVIDNGCGLPKENRHRLVEPYVTTRQKGTGLGLAIVHRITEQHGGVLELEDAPADEGYTHGAWIRMSIPISLGAGGSGGETEEVKPDGEVRESASGAPVNRGTEGVSHGV